MEAHQTRLNLHFGVSDTGSWRSQESRLFITGVPKLRNVKRRNPETGTSTKTPFRSFGDRDMEFGVSGIATWSVKISHHRNAEMSECRNAKNTFWCRFRIPGVGVSKHFTTGIPKCRNAEMRKTPFGAGFGYRELEVSKHFTTGMPKCRNVEM
jgi:hypothetical protein